MLQSNFTILASANDTLLNGVHIEGKLLYGSVFPHNTGVEYILQNNIWGGEICLSTESKGRHSWERLYRYPRYGIGYNYLNLGNPKILGSLHGLFGFIDIPFHNPKNKFAFTYKVDYGLGYFTKSYHSYENPLNHVVSSPYTVYIGLDFTGRFKLNKRNELKAAIELTHCSNGKTRTPNLGINTITVSASWLYSVKPSMEPKKSEPSNTYKKHFFELILNAGGKRDDNLRKEVFLVSSFIGDYYYAYSPKYSLGAGVDLMYDAALAQHKQYHENSPLDNSINTQMGAHLGFRARYGRMHILLNAGHYFLYDYLRHGTIYSRIGLRYAVTKSVLLNLTLKAHTTIADYIEWGIGYRFKTAGK